MLQYILMGKLLPILKISENKRVSNQTSDYNLYNCMLKAEC